MEIFVLKPPDSKKFSLSSEMQNDAFMHQMLLKVKLYVHQYKHHMHQNNIERDFLTFYNRIRI